MAQYDWALRKKEVPACPKTRVNPEDSRRKANTMIPLTWSTSRGQMHGDRKEPVGVRRGTVGSPGVMGAESGKVPDRF